MREDTADRTNASVGTWTGLRAFEAEIQARLAKDGIVATDAVVGSRASLPAKLGSEAKLRPLISGVTLVALAVLGWLAGPESRSSIGSARASVTLGSAGGTVFADAGHGRAPARPALRPGLAD